MDEKLLEEMGGVDKKIMDVVLKVAEEIGTRLDAEINNLDDIERVRAQRLLSMKEKAEEQKKYLAIGHGDYQEIEERDVFKVLGKSDRILLHFYTHESENCKILDCHLSKLCGKHLECRFLKIDAEKSPYFCDRLKIKIIPTCLLIVNGTVIDRLVGFTELNNTADFSTHCLEMKLVEKNLLLTREDGDLDEAKTKTKRTQFIPKHLASSIRESRNQNSEEEDW